MRSEERDRSPNQISKKQQQQNGRQKKASMSRVVSKEVCEPNSSGRVYYCEAAGAVPFMWESQPGTPKHTLFESYSLPPLTPPPSYAAAPNATAKRRAHSRPTLHLLVTSIFPKGMRTHTPSFSSSIFPKGMRTHTPSFSSSIFPKGMRTHTPSPSFSSSSSSSSRFSTKTPPPSFSSSSSSSSRFSAKTPPLSDHPLPFHYAPDFSDHDGDSAHISGSGSSPTSTLCFPPVQKKAWSFVSGCYAAKLTVKHGRVV